MIQAGLCVGDQGHRRADRNSLDRRKPWRNDPGDTRYRHRFPPCDAPGGIHFREILTDAALGPLCDTLLTQRGETRVIAFGADDPGEWLFHSHMLVHAAAGMTTWVEVG